MKKKLLIIICSLFVLLIVLFIISEYVYYFPFTTLSLDVECKTSIVQKDDDITITFVGDIMQSDTACSVIENHGYEFPFKYTRHILAKSDISIGNLEGPITEKCIKDPKKTWSYQVPKDSTKGLLYAGFDVMVLSNNHIRDCGDYGVAESIEHLNNIGITPIGGGKTHDEAHKPYIVNIKGVRIAFFGYLAPYIYLGETNFNYDRFAVSDKQYGGALGTLENVRNDFNKIRNQVDLIIVVYHLGDRYEDEVHEDYKKLLHDVIDSGADAVICHGTHKYWVIETYKDKPIYYGIGNFAFGSRNMKANFSLIANLYIDKNTKSIYQSQAIPIYVNNVNLMFNHQPIVLKGYQADKVNKDILESSKAFNSYLILKDNYIVQKLK